MFSSSFLVSPSVQPIKVVKVKVLNLIVLLLLFDNLIVITVREGKFEA